MFGIEPRADILHRVVTWQLEKRRATARGTRERADVARTGKKFGNQKGGGTARHGDRRAPVFIGGGKAHGARVRDFNPSLNKKIRALGLKMALSSHAKAGSLVVMDTFDGEGRQDQGAGWAISPSCTRASRRCSSMAIPSSRRSHSQRATSTA